MRAEIGLPQSDWPSVPLLFGTKRAKGVRMHTLESVSCIVLVGLHNTTSVGQ